MEDDDVLVGADDIEEMDGSAGSNGMDDCVLIKSGEEGDDSHQSLDTSSESIDT